MYPFNRLIRKTGLQRVKVTSQNHIRWRVYFQSKKHDNYLPWKTYIVSNFQLQLNNHAGSIGLPLFSFVMLLNCCIVLSLLYTEAIIKAAVRLQMQTVYFYYFFVKIWAHYIDLTSTKRFHNFFLSFFFSFLFFFFFFWFRGGVKRSKLIFFHFVDEFIVLEYIFEDVRLH